MKGMRHGGFIYGSNLKLMNRADIIDAVNRFSTT
jgi:hypothetical protein